MFVRLCIFQLSPGRGDVAHVAVHGDAEEGVSAEELVDARQVEHGGRPPLEVEHEQRDDPGEDVPDEWQDEDRLSAEVRPRA